jgi:dTDP-4-amino-4,6-dideoxygalactose transaminase
VVAEEPRRLADCVACRSGASAAQVSLSLCTRTEPGDGVVISFARFFTSASVAPVSVTSQMKARMNFQRSSSPKRKSS